MSLWAVVAAVSMTGCRRRDFEPYVPDIVLAYDLYICA